ncbi:lipid A export ATP-binding/permease protein MsbA [Candidatus Termititenax persephonae]|uniref:Lipid A export ATP-binding/permease protein MsbA n=1 Tax=Candidatus Termititenax persephonae TaxID=2218525 RepID=A0A388TGU0_9BACT|nr:lipid A export ATP-binding/permease protein MsbA [Candidatus Termititenax persephonae]
MKFYLRLWPFFREHWGRCLVVLANVGLFSVANIYFLALVKELSYDIERGRVGLFVYRICAGLTLALLRSLASYGQTYNMDWIGQRLIMKLRLRLYEHLQKLSMDFFSKWKIGDIMSRSTNDLQVVQNVFVANIVTLLPETATFFGVLIYLLVLSWKLLLLTLITLPLFAWLIQLFSVRMKRISKFNQRKLADLASILQESIYGISIIKAFAAEQKEIDKYTKENERSFWISMKSARLHCLQEPILFMLQIAMILFVFMVGGIQIIEGHITVGNFIAFCLGLGMLVNPVTAFGKLAVKQQQAHVALDRIFEVLDMEPTVKEAKKALHRTITGNVRIENLSFAYTAANGLVLKNIDLAVQAGEVIALVGPSGGGKTTLVNLLPRFYDATAGRVLIDGLDVKEYAFASLRSQIGIVTQETILFSGTIWDNIAYGKDQATQAEIEAAAQMANADKFIRLFPSGYLTYLGERGVRLSGGQKQRVAIARALLSDPKILILDEATSALDNESEKLVQQALENLMHNRTTFVIAHRLSTIIHADRIVVLDGGQISAIGRHEELLQTSPLYQKLYRLQLSKENG